MRDRWTKEQTDRRKKKWLDGWIGKQMDRWTRG